MRSLNPFVLMILAFIALSCGVKKPPAPLFAFPPGMDAGSPSPTPTPGAK